MRISTTQFSLQSIESDSDFWQRVEALIKQAHAESSEVLLLPEYFTLSWLVYRIGKKSFRQNLESANQLTPEFVEKLQNFSNQYQMTLIAGTIPVSENNLLFNRCFIFQPHKKYLWQDKINMTRFEDEEWEISGASPVLNCFTIGDFLCAVTTCYDVEFPSVTLMAAEKKVDILFVPSCTEDVHGYWRVRYCSQARTIENQCYVVMSSIVGGHPQWPEIESHYGQGGIFTPCDVGMPEGGVKKMGLLNKEGVITESLEKSELVRLRKNGTVLNLRDLGSK